MWGFAEVRDALRRRLKLAADDAHHQTEAAVDLHADVGTLSGYRRFIELMSATTIEHAAALDRSSVLAQLEPRSAELVSALASDRGPGCGDRLYVQPIPTPIASPNDSWAIGVGYALEGSALGALVVKRRCPEGASTNYLDVLLAGRRDRWVHYSRWLDELADDEHCVETMSAGAIAVFDSVRRGLDFQVATA